MSGRRCGRRDPLQNLASFNHWIMASLNSRRTLWTRNQLPEYACSSVIRLSYRSATHCLSRGSLHAFLFASQSRCDWIKRAPSSPTRFFRFWKYNCAISRSLADKSASWHMACSTVPRSAAQTKLGENVVSEEDGVSVGCGAGGISGCSAAGECCCGAIDDVGWD